MLVMIIEAHMYNGDYNNVFRTTWNLASKGFVC